MSRLVVTRKANESVMIGDDVKVTVVRIIGNRASLLIDAPESVKVNRQEVHDRLHKERLTDDPLAE